MTPSQTRLTNMANGGAFALTEAARAVLDDLVVHGSALWQRFTGGRNGSLWYYDQLANAFLRLIPGPATDRLVLVVKEMHLAA